jgi:hypothetical protein
VAAVPSRVFDPAVAALNSLVRRSLIVIDWRFNRDVRPVVRSKLAGMGNGRSVDTFRPPFASLSGRRLLPQSPC